MSEPLVGQTIQYSVNSERIGPRVLRATVLEISTVPAEPSWFKLDEDLGRGILFPVWYALAQIPDWKVVD